VCMLVVARVAIVVRVVSRDCCTSVVKLIQLELLSSADFQNNK